MTLRVIRWSALGLIVLIGLSLAVFEFGPATILRHQAQSGTSSASDGTVGIPAGVPIGGPFKLIDDKGHPVTDADYRGRWMLVFFGYTTALTNAR
jgi:protein SCO1/2